MRLFLQTSATLFQGKETLNAKETMRFFCMLCVVAFETHGA
jgi:hypothetical protein